MLIGVCGISGVGKNWFCKHLQIINPDLVHLDLDVLCHDILRSDDIKNKVIDLLGSFIIFKSGKYKGDINRRKVAELIYNNKYLMTKYLDIIYTELEIRLDTLFKYNPNGSFILNGALLTQSKYFNKCDITYLIKRKDKNRIDSVMKRDGITKNQLAMRDKNAIDYNENDFTYIVINTK